MQAKQTLPRLFSGPSPKRGFKQTVPFKKCSRNRQHTSKEDRKGERNEKRLHRGAAGVSARAVVEEAVPSDRKISAIND